MLLDVGTAGARLHELGIGPLEIGLIMLVIIILVLTFGWRRLEQSLRRSVRTAGSLKSELELGRLEGQRALEAERKKDV